VLISHRVAILDRLSRLASLLCSPSSLAPDCTQAHLRQRVISHAAAEVETPPSPSAAPSSLDALPEAPSASPSATNTGNTGNTGNKKDKYVLDLNGPGMRALTGQPLGKLAGAIAARLRDLKDVTISGADIESTNTLIKVGAAQLVCQCAGSPPGPMLLCGCVLVPSSPFSAQLMCLITSVSCCVLCVITWHSMLSMCAMCLACTLCAMRPPMLCNVPHPMLCDMPPQIIICSMCYPHCVTCLLTAGSVMCLLASCC
jgi:hypothetical protein